MGNTNPRIEIVSGSTMTKIKTIWNEKKKRHLIICCICKKPIQKDAYSTLDGKGFTHEGCAVV